MLPPGFKSSADIEIKQNPGQAYLWKCWEHFAEEVSKMPIAAVVCNGDAIDGEQRKQRGSELCLPLLADQTRAAAECLKYIKGKLKNNPKWYFVTGTPYHDSEAGREVEVLAGELGATPYEGPGSGHKSRRSLDLDVDGVICNFSHGISVSSGFYRSTAPDREGVFSALAGKEGKVPKADIVVRSHAHYFVGVQHENKWIVVSPCWELQTSYMAKNSAYRMLPSIGGIVIKIDPGAKKRREDPIGLKKFIYDLPPFKVTKL